MIQYFQLTPEILLEYIYDGDTKLDEDGIKGNVKDIYDDYPTMMLKSNAFGSKYLCFKNESEGLDSFSNLVLPTNDTETQFVVAKSKYQNFYSKVNASNIYSSKTGSGYMYEDTNYDKPIIDAGKSCDVKYDKCILHFNSRNYFGSYDALIFQAYVYMSNKTKLYLASFLFDKKYDVEFKAEHLLYNEKIYTKQVEFDIPSVFSIVNKDNEAFDNALKSQNIELLENTPIGINVYGVSGITKGTDNYNKLKTLKIKSISIPYTYSRLDEIHVKIYESKDGDYYCIDPEMNAKYSSFAEYIKSMGEEIRNYMIMHELKLKENWVDINGVLHSEITHKEFHIIDINEDDEDENISKEFDSIIKYRPICMYSGYDYTAIIEDTIKIINTVDNSSYEVKGSATVNPKKYGKSLRTMNDDILNRLSTRPIVNVYNKKVSDENSGKTINLNRGAGFVVENNSPNITSFIECTNIGVVVSELSPDDVN